MERGFFLSIFLKSLYIYSKIKKEQHKLSKVPLFISVISLIHC